MNPTTQIPTIAADGGVVASGEGEQQRWSETFVTEVKLEAPHLNLATFTMPRGAEPPLHVHEREDEFFYILEGEITAYVGEREYVAGPGAVVWFPRGVPHTMAARTDTVRAFGGATPGGFLQFHRDVAGLFPDGVPDMPTPEQADLFADACARHGMTLLGPNPGHAA